MTSTYQRSGIQFLYPENWTLADDSLDTFPRTISVQAPTGAFWSVDIHPFSVDPKDLLEQVLEAMRGEYEDLESTANNEEIVGHESVGFDLFFVCLDFVVASRIRAFRSGHATYQLTYQAEDREYEKIGAVFQAITHSFFQENDGE